MGEPPCEFDPTCERDGTERVRTITGVEVCCPNHAWVLRQIEAEWDQAERDYYDPPSQGVPVASSREKETK